MSVKSPIYTMPSIKLPFWEFCSLLLPESLARICSEAAERITMKILGIKTRMLT